MHPILVLLRKDISLFIRDKASIVLTFVVPFALIYLFGQIYHVNSPDTGPSGIPIGVVNQSSNPAAAKLVDALKAEKAFKVVADFKEPDGTRRPLREDDLRPLMKSDAFRFALVIPPDVIRKDSLGLRLKTYSNPRNSVEAQTVQGLFQKDLFTEAPQLIGQALQERARAYVGTRRFDEFNSRIASAVASTFGGDPARIRERMASGSFVPQAGEGDASPSHFLSTLVHIDNVQVAGADVKSPMATLLVGGWAMQFLLFALTSSATALFREKEHGIFQRILSAPVTRSDVLWSKFLYGICLGLVQLGTLFLAGHVLYGIDLGARFPELLVVCATAAAACTSFGMLIAAVSPTPEAARGLSTFAILLLCAIGGAWFPVSFMPEFIQKLSRLTLVYWSMEGFSQVLWARDGFMDILPTLGWLALITAIAMAVAVWRFRRGRIFE
ncbi:MAG TPA: ABC transporter permease [Opitutaceae bacterium]|jgi:ABC-2 type transport system permease protein